MTKFDPNKAIASLEKAGFILESRQPQSFVQYALPPVNEAARQGKARHGIQQQIPWVIEQLSLAERRSGFNIAKLDLSLRFDRLANNLKGLIKKYFGPKTTVDVKVSHDGDVWCLFEFSKPVTKNLKRQTDSSRHTEVYGFAGVKINVALEGTTLIVTQSEHFGFGFMPANTFVQPLRLALDALFLREVATDHELPVAYASLFEVRVPLVGVIAAELKQRGVTGSAVDDLLPLLLQMRPGQAPLMRYQQSHAHCRISQLERGDGWQLATMYPLPIEVLEAREVAGRFSGIDGHILAGRTSKAQAILITELQTRPSQLYLLRRFALLALSKGSVTEINAITPGLKIEPDYKGFLSLLAAHSIEAGDDEETLRVVSELGKQMMQQIPDADTVSAFELVMPETLGDAWGARDVGRATEC